MADNPDTGTGLSDDDGAAALSKLRARPEADKPKAEKPATQPVEEPEEDSDAGQPDVEAEESPGAETEGEGSTDTDETETESEQPAAKEVLLPNGKRIPAKEAAEGYLRREDHTRRLMEIAEARKSIERERAEVIPKLKQFIADNDVPPLDKLKLSKDLDPWAYQQRVAEYEMSIAKRQMASQQLDALERQQLVDAQQKAKEFLLTKSFEKAWSTEEGLMKGIEQVASWAAKDRGYDQEFLRKVTEPRLIEDLEKARRWDELQKTSVKAQAAVKGKPKPIKPGAKPSLTSGGREVQQLKNRFHQTKTTADAMSLLAKIRAA